MSSSPTSKRRISSERFVSRFEVRQTRPVASHPTPLCLIFVVVPHPQKMPSACGQRRLWPDCCHESLGIYFSCASDSILLTLPSDLKALRRLLGTIFVKGDMHTDLQQLAYDTHKSEPNVLNSVQGAPIVACHILRLVTYVGKCVHS